MAKIKQKVIRVVKYMEKLESSCLPGRNIKSCSHFRKVWPFLKKLNTELPYEYPSQENKKYVHTQETVHELSQQHYS